MTTLTKEPQEVETGSNTPTNHAVVGNQPKKSDDIQGVEQTIALNVNSSMRNQLRGFSVATYGAMVGLLISVTGWVLLATWLGGGLGWQIATTGVVTLLTVPSCLAFLVINRKWTTLESKKEKSNEKRNILTLFSASLIGAIFMPFFTLATLGALVLWKSFSRVRIFGPAMIGEVWRRLSNPSSQFQSDSPVSIVTRRPY